MSPTEVHDAARKRATKVSVPTHTDRKKTQKKRESEFTNSRITVQGHEHCPNNTHSEFPNSGNAVLMKRVRVWERRVRDIGINVSYMNMVIVSTSTFGYPFIGILVFRVIWNVA